MKIVGIDPGFATYGLAVIDSETMNCEKLKFFRTKKESKKRLSGIRVSDDDTRRVNEIVDFLMMEMPGRELGNMKPPPDFVIGLEAYSAFSKGKGWKAIFGYTAAVAVARMLDKALFVFTPGDIKKGICGKMSASKKEVWDVMFDQFEIDRSAYPKAALEHIGDALALAVLAKREQEKLRKLIGRV